MVVEVYSSGEDACNFASEIINQVFGMTMTQTHFRVLALHPRVGSTKDFSKFWFLEGAPRIWRGLTDSTSPENQVRN
jgi:hypothetical protein